MEDDSIEVNVDELENDSFMNHLNSTLLVKRDFESHVYDYEWLDIIEDVLPYIDNILRNPKRFIVNEEEIVKVELSKKITVESVIHLTQHTNLIQDYNEKTGDVKPSKVLNINKEESLDTYENRFIFTLINNLRTFFDERVSNTAVNSSYVDKKDLRYEGNSRVGTEEINFSLIINSTDKKEEENVSKNGLSYQERINQIKIQLDGFMGSELMITLGKLHVALVRSPIRKTNVILKNPNFKKAEELWNYIQSFVNKNKHQKDRDSYFDEDNLKKEYDQAILMTYIANREIGKDKNNVTLNKLLTDVVDRLIDNLLDSDDMLTEDKLKEIFTKRIKYIKNLNNNKKKVIFRIYKERIEKDRKEIINSFGFLK